MVIQHEKNLNPHKIIGSDNTTQLDLSKKVLSDPPVELFNNVDIRLNRLQRLIELNAPPAVLSHELEWLKFEVKRSCARVTGIDIPYSEQQMQELKELEEIESAYLDDKYDE